MPNKLIHQFSAPSATEGRASRVERAAKLKADIQSMEDAALQKRFAAIFDDAQGDNARAALVRYCRANGYHPSDITLLVGNTLLSRLWRMVKIQQRMIEEAEAKRAYLIHTIESGNG